LALSLPVLKGRIKEQEILRKVRQHPFAGKVYLVGGAIRELALSKTPKDYDFALTHRDDLTIFAGALEAGSFILGKKPIQTHRIVSGDLSVDITFLDTTIEEDLRRRDFTMNAIAYDLTAEEIIDTLQGLGDIRKKLIRYPEKATINSDPLRMLKAVRHFSTLKGFSLDGEMLSAMSELKSLIREVAPERIKYEMDRIITGGRAFEGLKAMERTGLLFEVLPELFSLKEMDREKGFVLETYGHTVDGFKYLKKRYKFYDFDEKTRRSVGYALLFHDLGKAYTFSYNEVKGAVHFFYHEKFSKEIAEGIMERLRFSAQEIRTIFALIENHMRIFLISGDGATGKAVRRLVYKMGELTPSLILLTLCDMYGSSGGQDNPTTRRVRARCREIMTAFEEWRKTPLPRIVNGHDLLAMGFPKGPEIGKLLEDIRQKQITGEIVQRDSALEYAASRLMGPEPNQSSHRPESQELER
jgi:tRNA nucleotidyltransferase/poly(A) polymerase